MIAVSNFDNFRRHPHESVDALLTRFERLKYLAERDAQFMLSVEVLTERLFKILNIPAETQGRLLEPYGDIYPTTEDQFNDLKEKIRRKLHITENAPNNIVAIQRGHARQGLGPGARNNDGHRGHHGHMEKGEIIAGTTTLLNQHQHHHLRE